MAGPLLVDDREPAGLELLIQANGVEAKRQRLDVGDMQFVDKNDDLILVTRKGSDLLTSLFSGHFSSEISRCMTTIDALGGGRLYLLLEGAWRSIGPHQVAQFHCGDAFYLDTQRHHKWGFQATSGAVHDSRFAVVAGLISSLQSSGVYFVSTATVEDTATMLATLYKQGQEGWPSTMTQALRREAKGMRTDPLQRVARLMSLWPRLSENKARALLKAHGDIATIVRLAGEDPPRLYVPGIGSKMVERFQEVLHGTRNSK